MHLTTAKRTPSSTESEYVALCEATTEIVFLCQLLDEIGFQQEDPTVVFKDNQSTIIMAEGSSNHNRTKHINVKYQFIREQVVAETIEIRYCPTEDMVADILTTGLGKILHVTHTRSLLNLLCTVRRMI